MSKAKVLKEIKGLDHDQLVELVMDIYAFSKEAHKYLEFYIDPDPDKLTAEMHERINKECQRFKRGMSRVRFTEINKLVKEYEGYGVGPEAVLNLMSYILQRTGIIEWFNYVPQSFYNGYEKFAAKMIKYGNTHAMADKCMEYLTLSLTHRNITDELKHRIRSVLVNESVNLK